MAVADGGRSGSVAVALNAFNERMGVIDIIGVDPDYQRRGVSSRLTEVATEHMRSRGMDIAVVETGGDPATHPRERHTKRPASLSCPSRVTSGYSAKSLEYGSTSGNIPEHSGKPEDVRLVGE